jgi:hypothetical protein
MSFTRNILPAAYNGMNKVMENTASSASQTPTSSASHVGGGNQEGGVACGAGGAGPHSISQRDKRLLLLQEQSELKKKQIIEDYRRIKNNVKENPYLQTVVTEYDKYFELQHKQIQALKALLQNVNKKEDKMEIKREIAALEKNLA